MKLDRETLRRAGACFDPWSEPRLVQEHAKHLSAELKTSELELDPEKLRRYKPQWYNWCVMKGLVPTRKAEAAARLKRLVESAKEAEIYADPV